MDSLDIVYLKCFKELGKLRIKIISGSYNRIANCQFPRDIRKENQIYSVPSTSIKFNEGRGTFFYSIRDKNKITLCNNVDEKEVSKIDLKNLKVFTVGEDETCVICFVEKMKYVFIPCGHFCICDECYQHLPSNKCPICRSIINKVVDHKLLTDEEPSSSMSTSVSSSIPSSSISPPILFSLPAIISPTMHDMQVNLSYKVEDITNSKGRRGINLEELKNICRSYKLKLGGNKEDVINRILEYAHNNSLVILTIKR